METESSTPPADEINLEVPSSTTLVSSDDEQEPNPTQNGVSHDEPIDALISGSPTLSEENERLRQELAELQQKHEEVLTENAELRHALHEIKDSGDSNEGVLVKLREKITKLEEEVVTERRNVEIVDEVRRQSVQEITDMNQKMFQHLVASEQQASEAKQRDELTMQELRDQIEKLTLLLDVEQDRSAAIDRQRAGSVKFLSNQRLKDLIEAEGEFMAEIESWKKRVTVLEEQVSEYQERELAKAEAENKVEEEPAQPTPGGDEEYLSIIAALQDQLMNSTQSKMMLLRNTMSEMDVLRQDLRLLGRENENWRESHENEKDSGESILSWVRSPW